MTNTRENHFWKINNVLANSWWRGIDMNCGAGWCRDKQREAQAIHICLVHSKQYMNEYACEAGWWTKDSQFAKELIRMWDLSGAWASLQPPSGQKSISADMMYGLCPSWVCPAPLPWRAWLPGMASGKPAVCRLLWSHDCGDFQKWSVWWSWRCHWVPPYPGFLSQVGRNQRKFPTDCLYSPASKRRVRFGVENVAQDECKPKKPHLFHGSSLYPQSQEIILLTEKTY